MRAGRFRVALAVATIVFGFVNVAPTAEIVVEGECSLIDAIHAANTDAAAGGCLAGNGADSIQLTGDVALFEIADSNRGENGLPAIESEIAIDGQGHTVTRAVQDVPFRHFHIARNGTLSLSDTTLVNGVGSTIYVVDVGGSVLNYGNLKLSGVTFLANGTDNDYGGAIFNGGQLDAVDTLFLGNVATEAGALWNFGDATLVNTTFSGNFSEGDAGAIANSSTLTALHTSFVGNTAYSRGGALNNLGTANIASSLFFGNFSRADGGGVYNSPKATLFVNDSEVAENIANETGGGIHNQGALEVQGTWIRNNRVPLDSFRGDGGGIYNNGNGSLLVTGSTFSGNEAEIGGGIYSAMTAVITDSTFSHNRASNNGGAIINLGDLQLDHVTLYGNFADGGISGLWFSDSGPTTSRSSIFGGHGNGGCGGDGLLIDLGGNLDDDGACGPGAGFLTGLDPNLADNGGPTPTHALNAGSSAIDVTACVPSIDQRGFLRLDGQCDSGAYELGAASLALDVQGTCPGQLDLSISGGTPNGEVSIAVSSSDGVFRLPAGSCAGTDLGLDAPRLLGTLTLDANGEATIARDVPVAGCGATLRVLDRLSCALSDSVIGP